MNTTRGEKLAESFVVVQQKSLLTDGAATRINHCNCIADGAATRINHCNCIADGAATIINQWN
jgi:hypothetical protein